MSREERLKQYADPSHSQWRGQSTQENINRWSERAHKETDGHKHRAKSGDVSLPSLGSRDAPGLHSTHRDARLEAKQDKNHVDKLSMYMKGIKRES
jgi:hypothetical protein